MILRPLRACEGEMQPNAANRQLNKHSINRVINKIFAFKGFPFVCLFEGRREMPKKKKGGAVAADAGADDDYDPDALLKVLIFKFWLH